VRKAQIAFLPHFSGNRGRSFGAGGNFEPDAGSGSLKDWIPILDWEAVAGFAVQ
jgi:hypothetical protein